MVVRVGAGLGLGAGGTEACRDDAVGGVVGERFGSRACEGRASSGASDPCEVLGLARDVACGVVCPGQNAGRRGAPEADVQPDWTLGRVIEVGAGDGLNPPSLTVTPP